MTIELAPMLACQTDDGCQHLSVCGQVISAAPLRELALFDRSGLAASQRFGPTEAAAGVLGFEFNVFREAGQAEVEWAFELEARQADGFAERVSYVIVPDGNSAAVTTGPVAEELSDNNSTPLVLHSERATLDSNNLLRVRGWIVAQSPVTELKLNGSPATAELGLPRSDVAASRPLYANAGHSGFDLVLPLTNGSGHDTLLLSAVSAYGAEQTIRLTPRKPKPAIDAELLMATPDPRRHIRLHCDEATLSADGRLSVCGWAISAIGIREVTVALGRYVLGRAEFGLLRDDVGDEYATIPMARHSGFKGTYSVPAEVPPDAAVHVAAYNAIGDTHDFVRPVEPAGAVPASIAPAMENPDRSFRIEIDTPVLVDGMAAEPVGSRLTIDGWVLSDSGVAGIDVLMDGHPAGAAHYGLVRQDVARAFPGREDAVRCGFAFHCPPRLLRAGDHVAELVARASNGEVLTRRSIPFEVRPIDERGGGTPVRHRITLAEANDYLAMLARHGATRRFCIMLGTLGSGNPEGLCRTLQSLSGQIYRDWQILIPEGAGVADLAPDLLEKRVFQNGDQWPQEIDLVTIMRAGDVLGVDALAEIALEAALSPLAELIYADECRAPVPGDPHEPFYKPDYSPNLLLATNYIGRPWFASVQLLRRAGITPLSLLSQGEYDTLLRCVEIANEVRHVSRLLCARGDDGDTADREYSALRAAAVRRGTVAQVAPGLVAGTWRVTRAIPDRPKVSIIIPTCAAGGHIEGCIASLRATTAGHDIEIVCIENIPPQFAHEKNWLQANVDVVISTDEPFNWSRFNNLAAAHASGEFLLFLNDDIEAEITGWLDAMLQHAAREEVGVVGPRLLYPNRTVQHAGMFLSEAGIGRHAFRFAAEDDGGYFGLALTERDVSAVTGACMLMRRQHFEALGGFDESHEVVNNDLDFCLRTADVDRQIIYTPYATLIHHEQASRAAMTDKYDSHRFNARWHTRFAKGDPYYNPHLSTSSDDFTPNEEPVRIVRSGNPLFKATDIRRILVIKVDHIGDFITALPAIRRLKSFFPSAEISVLAAPAAVAFEDLEPAISEILPFEFFHARSALGQKPITDSEIAALRARLVSRNFDLAVDLRKHLDTRRLLLATGARVLAGFDRAGAFPWLDIALEWEGDFGLHSKRSHITDDLLNLVQRVAAAGQDHTSLSPTATAALRDANPPPDALRTFFRRPVVCIHPGAGNDMKQWPEASFVALADLLVEELGANVLVIGGPDEVNIADRIAAGAADPVAVRSVAGLVSLRGLPALISRCALFVGNDSGPKHLAALVGIPTIGIHSGTVDPAEWAPLGPESVAIARVMRCSPCYFHRPADCMRSLACIREIPVGAVFQLCRRNLAGNI